MSKVKTRCLLCQEWVPCISHICEDCWTLLLLDAWRPRKSESVVDDKTFQRFLMRKERKQAILGQRAKLRQKSSIIPSSP